MDMLSEPKAWLLVVLLSTLGTVGNLALYKLGKEGLEVVISRFPRIKPERWHRARELFEKRGSWILLLSGVPGLGLVLMPLPERLGSECRSLSCGSWPARGYGIGSF